MFTSGTATNACRIAMTAFNQVVDSMPQLPSVVRMSRVRPALHVGVVPLLNVIVELTPSQNEGPDKRDCCLHDTMKSVGMIIAPSHLEFDPIPKSMREITLQKLDKLIVLIRGNQVLLFQGISKRHHLRPQFHERIFGQQTQYDTNQHS
jgi:hypothetical protein